MIEAYRPKFLRSALSLPADEQSSGPRALFASTVSVTGSREPRSRKDAAMALLPFVMVFRKRPVCFSDDPRRSFRPGRR